MTYQMPPNHPLMMSGMFQVERYVTDRQVDTLLLRLLGAILLSRPINVEFFPQEWAISELEALEKEEVQSFSASDEESEEEGTDQSSLVSSFGGSADSSLESSFIVESDGDDSKPASIRSKRSSKSNTRRVTPKPSTTYKDPCTV
jgi:hypothetical protein